MPTQRERNFPNAGTTFVGRSKERAALELRLVSTPLVTLIGPGGAGKTRLALEVARTISGEFQDGAAWVDLAPLAEPGRVGQAIASGFELREQSERSLLETLTSFLSSKQVLLIFDNCEHLLTECASIVTTLLRACPELQILATSREPLGIGQELVFPVPPLALPTESSEKSISESEAVRLFALRASEVLPGFALNETSSRAAARVCERLDGLPLAIELAAVRVKMLSVNEIVERLDDRFQLLTRSHGETISRHQTLRAAMDWSYHLLLPNEQNLFRRLSVFSGGFTLDAAETVCGEDKGEEKRLGEPERGHKSIHDAVPRSLILDLLSNLVEKSLVVIAERTESAATRFGMLETVREYARNLQAQKKLDGRDEMNTLRERHLEWCIALAERAVPELYAADSARWFARLAKERDNFRAARRWAVESLQTEAGLRLGNAIWVAWEFTGNYSEGLHWFNELLAQGQDNVSPVIRSRALFCFAALMYRVGELARAEQLTEQSLALVQGIDDPTVSKAQPHNMLGLIATDRAQFARAIKYYELARELYAQEGNAAGAAGVLNNLGHAAHKQGELARAAQYLEERVAFARQNGDLGGLAITLINLGEVESDRAQYPRAEGYFRESMALSREIGSKLGIANSLDNLAVSAYCQGRYEDALSLSTQALELSNEIGAKRDSAAAMRTLGNVLAAHGEIERATVQYEKALLLFQELGDQVGIGLVSNNLAALMLQRGSWTRASGLQHDALKLFQDVGNKQMLALSLEGTAEFAIARAEHARAAEFLGAAAALREQLGTPPHVPEGLAIARTKDLAHAALGEESYSNGFERGRALTLGKVISEALTMTQVDAQPFEPAARPALEILALGSSAVQREGHSMSSSDWTYLKSKESFFYLLSHPNATKAQIGLDLWADASPQQLRREFHRTLHFMRKALEHPDWIAFENGHYGLSPTLRYVYDVEAFETHLSRAQQLLRGDTTSHAMGMEALDAGVELYQGDFLADLEGGDWIVFRREELRKTLLDALLTLGQSRFDAAQYGLAAVAYQRALAEDEYLEIAHRELMRSLARQGEVSRALRHYQMLADLLQREVGASPSPQTQALYDRLKRGEID